MPSMQGLGDDLGGEQQQRPESLPPPPPARVCASRPCLNTGARHKAVRQQNNSVAPPAGEARQPVRQGERPRKPTTNVPVNMHGREHALDARSRGRSWWRTATTARISSPTPSRPCLRLTPMFEHGREAQSRASAGHFPECSPPHPARRTARVLWTAERGSGARERSDRVDEGRARDGGRLPASEASQTTQQPPPSPRD